MSKTKFDQHFLINPKILTKMINEIPNLEDKSILEIGGGEGILTKEILNLNPKQLTCVEIDDELIPTLQNLIPKPHSLIHIDALEFLKSQKENSFNIIIGNIPYSITEQLFKQLYFLKPQLVLFLQPDSFTKTIINNSTKLAQLINSIYLIKKISTVNGDNFKPHAKTQSSIIKLELKEDRTKLEQFLYELTKRYNQTFENACVYSIAKVLSTGKKDAKNLLLTNNINISKNKLDTISNEEFSKIISKIRNNLLD